MSAFVATWLTGLGAAVLLMFSAWLLSLRLRDAGVIDGFWGAGFVVVTWIYFALGDGTPQRKLILALLVTLWGVRLSAHIVRRNHGKPEDYRYQTIRENNEPGFTFKSLYLVFGLQGLLAWIISLPLLLAITSSAELGLLDAAAALLWLVGFVFEAGGDYQLSRFKANPDNKGKVLDSGLWGLTRHPNYFGDFCVWWAYFLFAVAAGGWWSIASPILMSILLLKVSGVAMLEKTIVERRPKYADYIRRTNAFFP